MYYVSLNNINLEKKLGISQDKLKKADEILNLLLPNQTISPIFFSRKTNIELNITKKLLVELSYRSIIGVLFIIQCENEDSDMVHAFEFSSENELSQFIDKNEVICPHCESELLTSKIRVAFIKTNYESYNGESYG